MAINRLQCKRCGHTWLPRQVAMPKQCPLCHSLNWNKARKPKPKKR